MVKKPSKKKEEKTLLPKIVGDSITISFLRLKTILRNFSTKSPKHSKISKLILAYPEILTEDPSNVDIEFLRLKTRSKTSEINHIIEDLYMTIEITQKECSEPIPRIGEIEFEDVIKRFSAKGKDYKKLVTLIQEDPGIMTGDTKRINKTALCKSSGLKSKKIDEMLTQLKAMFVEAERSCNEMEEFEKKALFHEIEMEVQPQEKPQDKPRIIQRPKPIIRRPESITILHDRKENSGI